MLRVRDVILGDGVPKICVPIVSKTHEEIINEVRNLHGISCDIVEFRGDFYEDLEDIERLLELLKGIREEVCNLPVIFTIRTANEGGNIAISYEKYSKLLLEVAKSGLVDIIDVECFMSEKTNRLIEKIHENKTYVIGSNHDFDKTDELEILKTKLRKISECGADIPKLAVMPKTKADVIKLLIASEEISRELDKPIVTMSMGKLGVISRIGGEIFGSAMTFGTNGAASAPGQIDANYLSELLNLLHCE